MADSIVIGNVTIKPLFNRGGWRYYVFDDGVYINFAKSKDGNGDLLPIGTLMGSVYYAWIGSIVEGDKKRNPDMNFFDLEYMQTFLRKTFKFGDYGFLYHKYRYQKWEIVFGFSWKNSKNKCNDYGIVEDIICKVAYDLCMKKIKAIIQNCVK